MLTFLMVKYILKKSFTVLMIWLLGQAVKTPPFHGGNTGSSPVGVITTFLIRNFYFKKIKKLLTLD